MKRLSGHTFTKPCCKNCHHFKKIKKNNSKYCATYLYVCNIYKKQVPYSGMDYPIWCKDKFREKIL